MARWKQIFVCATAGEGRCGEKGGGELLRLFEDEVEHRGLSEVMVVRNGCTRQHDRGPVVFVSPDDTWHYEVRPEEVPQIVERHAMLRGS